VLESIHEVSKQLFCPKKYLSMPIIHDNPKLKALAAHLRSQGTKSEIILWNQLKGSQVNGFRFIRQKPIGDYIVDFYCKEVGLVIELDGLSHQYNEVMDLDERKQSYLESIGLKVIRFEDEDVIRDLPNVMRVIEYTALSLKPMK
jgi:very-short-patch-repair endonuclease